MKYILILFLFIFSYAGYSQDLSVLTTLSDELSETSGTVFLNNTLITHNDSGNEPYLYTVDRESGEVLRTVIIENATNVDWEDICIDDEYIYIGDFGNNLGARTDLKIYKISIFDFENNSNVSAEIIEFNYADQLDFTPDPYITNYDAEALISKDDYLYVFTKNWGNNATNVYQIPKNTGNYTVELGETLYVQGYITGAVYSETSDRLVLSGYTLFSTFVTVLRNFSNSDFSSGEMNKYVLQFPAGYSKQVESVSFNTDNSVFITAEQQNSNLSALYSVDLEEQFAISIEENEQVIIDNIQIYPNPTSDYFQFNNNGNNLVEVYTGEGKLVKSTFGNKVDISKFDSGIYFVRRYNAEGGFDLSQVVVSKN